MSTPLWFWIIFNAAVLIILALDLGISSRHARAVSLKEAGLRTAVFVALGLLFALLVWRLRGPDSGMKFLTGYVIEYSLSVDNIFVFVVLFNYFAVPAAYQHRVLFWGILTALVLRGLMIAMGVALIERFTWIIYVFGAFLLVTGVRMLFQAETKVDPAKNPIVRFSRRLIPITPEYEGSRFLVHRGGKLLATPLLLVFVVVNVTDVVFAVDSIPAIFGITTDPFIVYTSNICAILGLRSLYFLLAGVMNLFCYLQTGLALVLAFVGAKMLLTDIFHIDTLWSLGIVLTILGVSIALSLLRGRNPTESKPG